MNPALPKTKEINYDRKSGVNPALPKSNSCMQVRDNSWHYVYLLASQKTPWIYIGCTNDLRKRLNEHKEGKAFSTRKMLPIELVYYEAYRVKDHAYGREKSLKKYGSGLSKLKARLGIGKKGRAGCV